MEQAVENFNPSYHRLRDRLVATTSQGKLLSFSMRDGVITALGYHSVGLRFARQADSVVLTLEGPGPSVDGYHPPVEYKCAKATLHTVPFPYSTAVAALAGRVEEMLRRAVVDLERRQAQQARAAERLGWWMEVEEVEPVGPYGGTVRASTGEEPWLLQLSNRMGGYLSSDATLRHRQAINKGITLAASSDGWRASLHVRITPSNVKEVLTFLAGFITLPDQG